MALCAGTLLAALLCAIALVALTQTTQGRAWLCREVNQALATRFVGRLHIDDFRLRFGPRPRLELRGVVLTNATGAPIASASAIALSPRLSALAQGHLKLSTLDVQALSLSPPPLFHAFTSSAASPSSSNSVWANLLHIFDAFTSSASKEARSNSVWKDRLPSFQALFQSLIRRLSLSIEEGRIEVQALSFRGGHEARDLVRLNDLTVQFSAHLRASRFELRLAAQGTIASPVTRPLEVDLSAHGIPWTLAKLEQLRARLGPSRLSARGDWQPQKANLIVESLQIGPDFPGLSRLWPSRVGPSLEADGAAMWRAGELNAVVQARLGALHTELTGHWQSQPGTRLGRGHLSMALAHAALDAGATLRAHVDLLGDRLELTDLDLSIDGARLVGQGAIQCPKRGERLADQLDMALTLDVQSIASGRVALEKILDRRLPAMTGAAQVTARFFGPLSPRDNGPTLQMNTRVERLHTGAFRLADASLDLNVPNLARPWALTASLFARRAQIGPQTFRALAAHLHSDGHRLTAQTRLRLSAPKTTTDAARLHLTLAAHLSPARDALRVDRLSIALPRHTFELRRPATLRLDQGLQSLSVDQLLLASGPQSLSIAGGLNRDTLSLRFKARQIELTALSPWLLALAPRRLFQSASLTGRIHLDAVLNGMRQRPTGELHLWAHDLAIGANAPVNLHLTARAHRQLLLQARLGQKNHALRLDARLPRLWETGSARRPIWARLHVDEVDLSQLPWRAWTSDLALSLSGHLSGSAEVTGTRAHPKARLRLNARHLTFHPDWPRLNADLDADFSDSMALRLSLTLPHGALDLTAQLNTSPGLVLRHLSQARALSLLNQPMSLSACWQGVQLGDFNALWPQADLRGQVSGTLSLSGTRRGPRGTLNLDIRQASLRQGLLKTSMALDLALRLNLKRTGVELFANMAADQRPLMRVDASLACDARQLLSHNHPFRQLSHAPLQAAIKLGPIALKQWPRASALSTGTLDARARLDGTLHVPRLSIQGALRDFWLGPEGVGILRFHGGYQNGRLSLRTRLSRLDKIHPADLTGDVMELLKTIVDP